MRIAVTIIALCLGTAFATAVPVDIAVSPDGRYVVRFMQGKREVPVPTWNRNKFAGDKMETWNVVSLVLLDRRSGEMLRLVDYDPQGGPLPTQVSEFKAAWSPDGRYVALSYPQNRKTENFFDGKGRVFVTSNQPPDAEVALVRVKNGQCEFVDLPDFAVFNTSQRTDARPGQVVDHWEGARTLWGIDGRKGKLYRYQLR